MGMGKEHGEWATLNWKIKHFNHWVQVTRVKYEMLSHFAPGLVVAVKMVENRLVNVGIGRVMKRYAIENLR